MQAKDKQSSLKYLRGALTQRNNESNKYQTLEEGVHMFSPKVEQKISAVFTQYQMEHEDIRQKAELLAEE